MNLVLKNPQFRLLWFSAIFSSMARMMYFMVHGWLALVISDSPFWVGATMGAHGVGIMAFSGLGGVLADRIERRKLILISEATSGAATFVLAALIFSGHVQLWHLLVLALLTGMMSAFMVPASMALTLDLVGRKRLLTATAAIFASMTVMGAVSPLIGGFVVSKFDIGWAYIIMATAYVAATGFVLRLHDVPIVKASTASHWEDLKEGVKYVFTSRAVRALMIVLVVTEGFGWAHEAMLPVMARDVLHVGPSGLGYLMAAASAGGTVSTLIVSSLGDFRNKGGLLILGHGGFAVFLLLFASSRSFPLSMALLAAAYAMNFVYEAMMNTLLQTAVPDNMRGRVLSFQAFSWGLTGFSGFYTGGIASRFGAPLAIALGGGVVLLNALRIARGASRFNVQVDEGQPGDGE